MENNISIYVIATRILFKLKFINNGKYITECKFLFSTFHNMNLILFI